MLHITAAIVEVEPLWIKTRCIESTAAQLSALCQPERLRLYEPRLWGHADRCPMRPLLWILRVHCVVFAAATIATIASCASVGAAALAAAAASRPAAVCTPL